LCHVSLILFFMRVDLWYQHVRVCPYVCHSYYYCHVLVTGHGACIDDWIY
jgi:hypothetical protein